MTTPRVRKSIDKLTPQELADYEHAYSKLIEISKADPDSIDGLTYFQNLHDGMLGPCEHANDTFLPWHRAHLYLFEEALRRSDPPRTANVTVPYWDWSALPTGARYPKAFERAASILHHVGRNDDPICRTNSATGCDALPFPRQFLEDTVLNKSAWSTDDPATSLLKSFGGFAGGQGECQGQFGEGFGVLEEPPHNDMHSLYVGGSMGDPSEAAQDPIFFSFHSYIDLLWAQWQEDFETNTDLEAKLCGLFKDRDHLEENRFRVEDTLDTEAQLGYRYEYEAAEPAPPTPVAIFPPHPAIDFVASARSEPALVRTADFTVPKPGVESAVLKFTDVHVTTSFSYGADVYLTPADEELRTQDRAFRARYLADMLFFWKAHHSEGDNKHVIAIDIGRALTHLAKSHAGERWVVSVALTAVDAGHHGGGHDHGGGHGGGHDHGGGHERGPAAAVELTPADIMNFGALTLDIR